MPSPDVQRLLDGHRSLTYNEQTNKVKCSLTSHEMPAEVKAIESYLNGKKYKRLADLDAFSFEDHKTHIVPNSKKENEMFCRLTLRHLEKTPQAIQRHIDGKKYKNSLARWKECQKTGAKFTPLNYHKGKAREEQEVQISNKKAKNEATTDETGSTMDDDDDDDIDKVEEDEVDDNDDADDCADDFSDLYPEADFQEQEEGEGDEDMEDSDSVPKEKIPQSKRKNEDNKNQQTKKKQKSGKASKNGNKSKGGAKASDTHVKKNGKAKSESDTSNVAATSSNSTKSKTRSGKQNGKNSVVKKKIKT